MYIFSSENKLGAFYGGYSLWRAYGSFDFLIHSKAASSIIFKKDFSRWYVPKHSFTKQMDTDVFFCIQKTTGQVLR